MTLAMTPQAEYEGGGTFLSTWVLTTFFPWMSATALFDQAVSVMADTG